MRIKHVFLLLTIGCPLNFICKAADINEKLPILTIKDCKAQAEQLFKSRKLYKDMLSLASQNTAIFNNVIFRINHCDNELRNLLQSVQIISMTLYSNIKNKLDSLQAEERYENDNLMKSFKRQL